ncbi:M23 family metallopeptidase [Paradesulfitobacterium ferrireducens]|uniref:M23 family metallopeptidase n=1 Tax=Paradesulfitobacterium ferrireducens TaxID=2816476 RepID=UPI001A90AEA3|nr:M23 family metallopeptidase [Paradesulfitobacterium ferrireducens]
MSKGYDPMKIDSMDRGDFLKLKDTWNLSPEVIKAAKVIYPELNNLDLSTWTYGKYYKYSKIKDDEKYRPMPEQINQFRGRGITLADARYMLKDFNNYQAILNLSDDEIKEYLLGYYKFKETYAKTLKGIERNKKDSNNKASFRISATSKIIDGATYYYCYVPGYGYDWFHETSQTHVGINSDMYGADAQQIFEAIYPSGGSYYATNMWGTYSLAHTGAHEGIDFNGTPEGQNLLAVVDGSLGQRDSTWGQIAISSTETTHAVNYRIFYMHMVNISPYSTINAGQIIGKESNVNTDGIHLHLQVYHNQSQTYCHTSDDNILSSDSPYSIFYTWV